jgi:hypothetical protein
MNYTDTDSDAWYVRESSDPACTDRLLELKELLNILDRRWKVAGQYLLIIDEFWNRADLRPNPEEEALMARFRVV